MSHPLTWQRPLWPREEMQAVQARAALLALNGLSNPRRRDVIILQVTATAGRIEHRLAVPEPLAPAVTRQLQSAVPGLLMEPVDPEPLSVTRAWQAWQSTGRRPLNTSDTESISIGLLVALSALQRDESLTLQWILGPVRRPAAVGNKVPGGAEDLALALASAPLGTPLDLDAEARTALRTKQAAPGWRAALRIGVAAEGTRRQRRLLGQLAAAVRTAQASGVQVGFKPYPARLVREARRPWRFRLVVNVEELTGLMAWPLGDTGHLPIARALSRSLPPARSIPRSGRIIGDATYPGFQRPLALGPRDATKGLHVIGATGTGKSTLLLSLIIADLAAGRGCVVIEPKGDLIADILARIPENRLDDVVLLDPTDDRPVGLNPLAQPGVPGEVIVDQVLSVFKRLFGDSIGPRSQDLLTSGLLTLVSRPGLSLAALPVLFTDAGFRRSLTANLSDSLALGPFWSWFEHLSVAERGAVLAPLNNKLRVFLLRPRLRRVIGQAEPKFDLREVFTKRRILLCNLQKGLLGPEASALLGSLVVSQVWQAALGRSAVPVEQRAPVMITVDEFQDYVATPQDFGDVISQGRALGCSLQISHQHWGQLPPALKAAVLNNARSRVLFQMSPDDATVFVKGDPRLTAQDVSSLSDYEAYASLLANGESTPYASLRTRPAPDPVSDPAAVRERSRMRWGVPAADIDAVLEALVTQKNPKVGRSSSPATFGVRPRPTETNEEDET